MQRPVTHKKIIDCSPRWRRYPGLSLLFDNPEGSWAPDDSLWRLDTSRDVMFYRAVDEAVTTAGLRALEGLCWLPYASLHVTALDGIHVGNVAELPPALQPKARRYLNRLPGSIRSASTPESPRPESHKRPAPEQPAFVTHLQPSALTETHWPLAFEADRLVIWGASALALRLRPAPGTEAAYQQLTQAREALRQSYAEQFGVAARALYEPHVTLGYFANPQAARHAQQQAELLGTVSSALRDKTAGAARLQLARVGLYGFTDMATFYRFGAPPNR
jgi:hypothetical protein